MKTIKADSLLGHIFFLLAVTTSVFSAQAQTVQTNLAVTVRHAPSLNGGTIQGTLQQFNGESLTVNSGFAMTGDLLVPGTPTVVSNGTPSYSGIIAGSGSTTPTGYQVMFNSGISLRYLRTRTTTVSLQTVSAPPSPTGTRSVNINSAGQSYGDATTLRDLTLNGNVGMISVPPGTYGTFNVSGGAGLVLGVAGGLQAVNYNLQSLNLNSGSTVKVVGPVLLTVATGLSANGIVGASNNPTWLQLQVASGGLTLNSGCTVYGLVLAPNGMVIVNGSSTLVGTSASDQFTLNSGGLVRWGGSSTQTNQPPVATAQSITLAENSSTNITLTGTDPQGGPLTFTVLTSPAHGTVSGTPPSVTYKPVTNYFGSDAFTFKVSNGFTDSSPATVSLTITQVYYPPIALAQTLTNFEDTILPVTLTGYDLQNYALTFSVLTQPAHGTLSGTAPNLTYLPATNYFGNDSFTFRVNDGVSNSLAGSISITNKPVDDPPIVVAGPNQLIILPTNYVYLSGSVTYDSFPGTVDTVVWSKVSGPGSVTFSSPSNTSTTATFGTNGIYRLRLFASDSFLSGSNDLWVTVDAPPVAVAGPSMTNTFPGTITLAGSANDDGLPTNGALTVVWSKVSGPGTVTFGNATATNSAVTFGTNGIYILRLTASDSIATNHSDLTVIENQPPVVNAGGNILTNGLNAVLNGTVMDDGLPGGFLSAQWAQASGPGTVTFSNISATNSRVTASQSGTYVLMLTGNDGAATNTGEVVVTFNLPPVVNAGPTQTVNFGATVLLAGTVTDDQLPYNTLSSTWSKTSGPGNAVFVNASLTNTTVTFDQSGIYTLLLTASDGLATTNASVVIRVNAAPVVNAGTNQLVPLGNLVALMGSYTDDGISGSAVTTFWTQISGPTGAVFANQTATNTTVGFTQGGVYVFQLTANDGLTNGSAQVTITVDQAPAVTAASPYLINWPANQVLLSGTVTDDGLPNGGILTSAWSQISGPSPINFSAPSSTVALNGTTTVASPSSAATFSAPGLYLLRLTGNDGLAVNHADVVVIVNLPPTANAGTNQIIIWPANQVALQGTSADDGLPVGSSLTTTWSKVSGPGAAAFANASNTNTTATFSTNGVYVLKLTASDGASSNSSTVTITVDQAPVVTVATPAVITWPSNQALLNGIVTDDGLPSGGILSQTFSLVSGPGTVSFQPTTATNLLTGTPVSNTIASSASFSASGLYVVKLTASDGLTTSSSNVTVTVNQPPMVNAGTNQSITWPANQVTLQGTAADDGLPAGSSLATSWSEVSGQGTVVFGNVSATNTTATFSTNGVYVLKLSASDGVSSNSGTVTITVNHALINQAPIVALATPLIITWPSNQIVLTGRVMDDGLPSGGFLNQTFSLVSGPGTVSFSPAMVTNLLAGTVVSNVIASTARFSAAGLYVVRLTASDGLTNGSAQVTIIVNQAPVVNAGLNQTVSISNLVRLHGSTSDDGFPVGVTVTSEWVKVSGPGIVRFGNINAADTTATFSQPGIYVLQLIASDTISLNNSTVSITVTPAGANQPPAVYAGPDQNIGGTNVASLSGVVTDDNYFGNGYLYAWWSLQSGPGTISFANSNAPVTSAMFSAPGVYVLKLSATDSQYTNSDTVTITIYPDNQPPTVDPGHSQNIFVSTANLAGQVRDDGLPQGAILSANWSQVSGPGSAFFAVPSSAATTVSFSQPGSYVLQLSASDTQFTVCSNVTINVQFNQAPVVSAGQDQEIVNTNQTILHGWTTDDGLPVGGTLSTTWLLVNGPSTAVFSDVHATNATVTFGDQGAYQLRLSATDGQLTSFDDVTIIVTSSNSIPYQATNILYRFATTIDTNFYVPDYDESGFTNGQGGFGNYGFCGLNNPTYIHTYWPGAMGGLPYLQIRRHFYVPPGTTNLDMGFTVDNNAEIFINGVLISPHNVANPIYNGGFSYGAPWFDHQNCPNYDDLILSGISTNIWQVGNNVLAVQIEDDGGLAFFDARISPNMPSGILLNQPPFPQVNTNQFVVYPSVLTLAATVQDDGLPLNASKTATWTQLSGPGTVRFSQPASSFAVSNDVSTLAAFSVPGTYQLRLTANDSDLSEYVDVTVLVSSVTNAPPIVSAGADQTISLEGTVALNGVATDDGFPFGTLTTGWSLSSGPGNASFTTLDGTTYASFSAIGDYVLRFSASDGAATSTANVTIHVLPAVSRSLRINTSYASQVDVSAGVDIVAKIFDDGLPAGLALTDQWTTISGPAIAVFSQRIDNFPGVSVHASFPIAGNYLLRLTAGDGQLTGSADVAIAVTDLYHGNHAPVVNPGLAMTATTTAPISLHGTASDDGLPVGGAFTTLWQELSGPTAVVFGNPTLTNTTVAFNAQGIYVLQLTASDGQLSSSASVTVVVTNSFSQSLLVYAGEDTTLPRQDSIELDGIVLDDNLPVGGSVSYQWSLVNGPGIATFSTASNNSVGSTVWLPVQNELATVNAKFSVAGSYVLQLAATDSQVTNYDTLTITVVDGTNTAPVVYAGDPQSIQLNNAVALHPVVTDDGLPNGILTLNWSEVSGPGTVAFNQVSGNYYATFSAAGVYDLRLIASDGQLSGSNDVSVTVYASLPPPTVVITAPDDAGIITSPTNIIGTASSPILQSYQLQYRFKNPDDVAPNAWTIFANGSASVTNGVLGLVDPTMLLNGIYEMQLVASDSMGNTASSVIQTFSIERNLKIGNFTLSFNDLNVPVSGIPIQIIRTYDSRNQNTNDFGVGWSLEIRNIKLQKTRSLGPNWYQDTFIGDFGLTSYMLDPVQPREITITMAGDKVYHFQAVLSPTEQIAYPIESVAVTFTNQPGTYGGLAIDGDNHPEVDSSLGYVNLINISDFTYFNPTRFRFTNEVGDVYIIDEKSGLQSLTDRNQNTLVIATNGIIWTNAMTGSSGVGVSFARDAQGRIAQIIDPSGNVLNYTYGTNGSLAAFTDRTTNTTTFAYTNTYFPHYLTSITDPRGNQAIRTVFDDGGRMIQQIDADGNVINFNHDFSNDREEVTDRLGHTTVSYYDDHGNVVATIDAFGNLTTSKYNEVDNMIEKVDALGNTNRYAYDGQGNKLTETDPLGYTTSYTYGPYRELTSITTPRGYTTTNVYDPTAGTLTQETDPLGNVTTYSYDVVGNLLTRTDALGNVISNNYENYSPHISYTAVIDAQQGLLNASSFTYDSNGNQLTKTTTRTTPHGVETLTTQFTYDGENRLLQTIHPDGSTNTTIYAVGLDKPAVEIDPLGRQTHYFYDERGNLTNTVFADLTFESAAYDAENRKIAMTDRAGRTTFYTNDALARLTATRLPDGAVTQTAYDAIGREIATVDELNNTNRFDYDPNCGCSGRKADVIDPLGHVTHYTYDEDANQKTMLDALGRTVTYVYDPLDRPVSTTFQDGTQTVTTYDALGRRVAETDQNSNTTWFAYDALGRLAAVTNALGKVTSYGYDEMGNLISETDANNHTTTFEYDSMGRRLKRTLPGNQVETYAYDLAGNLTNKVDFNGHATGYAYDSVNRLLTKTPDAAFSAPPVTMTYTATGQRATMNDAGSTTIYYYNSRDWLTNKSVRFFIPGGARYTSVLGYTYDAHGNVTHISSSDPNGVDLGYTYDPLNRLENVTDAQTGTTTYGYDNVGNLAGYVYPNNVSSTYAYDSLNRLTNLMSANVQLAPVAFYRYTVATGGQRLTANENVVLTNGVRTINRLYSYDPTYRLTHEGLSVTDPVVLPVSAGVGYTLDDVGNRLARQSTLNSILSTSSSFDANDRLTSDTYDANGNTIAGHVTSTAPAVSDQYDFEDRLINRNHGQIVISYDGDGNRVSKTVAGVTTLYLVDDRNPSGYAQVLEEETTTGGTPAVTRAYAYGHSIISQEQIDAIFHFPTAISYYGTDGHGNVRYLTDPAGNVTDTYDYDAFGNLIAQSSISQLPTPNSYLYCGEQFDSDLGLYYNRARYLDSDSGRFWTRDIFEGFQDDVVSLHKYLYTEDNPINQIDPTGFESLVEVEGAEAVGEDVEAAAAREGAQQTQKTFRRQACHIASSMMGAYDDLEKLYKEFGLQRHHIYQKAKFLGNGKYNPGTALAIYLLGGTDSPHGAATSVQNSATSGAGATQIAYDALIAAGCSPEDAKNIVAVAKQQMEDEFNIGGL